MQYKDLRVLIVEDDDFQCNLIVSMLHALELHSISVANNGLDALKLIRDNHIRFFDLVISDLKMPGMDGVALLRHIAEENHDIKVIILSALDKKLLAAVDKVSSLYKIKLLDTLEKPLTLQQLKIALSKATSFQPYTLGAQQERREYTVEQIQRGIRLNQFIPYLQPKVDLKTGQIIGAEALARWEHPEDGIVAPNAFIPILEQHKQIDELTFCMLKAAALACKKLISNHHPINIAVNLSLVSLDDTAMAERITKAINEAGLSTQHITLELTESAAMTDAPHALENLARLYMDGFTLSIDDYGTGYSNLQQLTRVAFGELKIDQSFVQGIADNDDMLVIVASCVDMAHKLNMKIVMEGIESEEDWNLLKKLGCDVGQGYLIAKPMHPDSFYAFVNNYTVNPIATTPLNIREQTHAKRKENEAYKLLIIDSDRFIRRVITEILSGLGYTDTKTAANTESAIKRLEEQQFDLILTDVVMSGISGLELIKRIRTGTTLAAPDTRIIALSNLTQSSILGAALALDINGLIVKPITPDIVEKKVKHALSEPTHIHPKIAYESVNIDFPTNLEDSSPEQVSNSSQTSIESLEAFYVSIQALTEGMIIKKAVYNQSGVLILNIDAVLTDSIIKHLITDRETLASEDFLVEQPESLKTNQLP